MADDHAYDDPPKVMAVGSNMNEPALRKAPNQSISPSFVLVGTPGRGWYGGLTKI